MISANRDWLKLTRDRKISDLCEDFLGLPQERIVCGNTPKSYPQLQRFLTCNYFVVRCASMHRAKELPVSVLAHPLSPGEMGLPGTARTCWLADRIDPEH